jgi:hypothetical protein
VLAERARGGENRQALLDDILRIVLDPEIGDDQVGARLRGEIGHERMRAAWEARRERADVAQAGTAAGQAFWPPDGR